MKTEFDKAIEKVSEYIEKFNGNKVKLSNNSTSDMLYANTIITRNTIATEVAVVQPKAKNFPDIIFSSASVKLPQENLVAFFRQLLIWNNLQTETCHFALNDTTNIVYLIMRRPFEGLEYQEFKYGLETISNTNMNCLILLKKQFAV